MSLSIGMISRVLHIVPTLLSIKFSINITRKNTRIDPYFLCHYHIQRRQFEEEGGQKIEFTVEWCSIHQVSYKTLPSDLVFSPGVAKTYYPLLYYLILLIFLSPTCDLFHISSFVSSNYCI